jgi:hypothetical protein
MSQKRTFEEADSYEREAELGSDEDIFAVTEDMFKSMRNRNLFLLKSFKDAVRLENLVSRVRRHTGFPKVQIRVIDNSALEPAVGNQMMPREQILYGTASANVLVDNDLNADFDILVPDFASTSQATVTFQVRVTSHRVSTRFDWQDLSGKENSGFVLGQVITFRSMYMNDSFVNPVQPELSPDAPTVDSIFSMSNVFVANRIREDNILVYAVFVD